MNLGCQGLGTLQGGAWAGFSVWGLLGWGAGHLSGHLGVRTWDGTPGRGEALRAARKGAGATLVQVPEPLQVEGDPDEELQLLLELPHGHVAAAAGRLEHLPGLLQQHPHGEHVRSLVEGQCGARGPDAARGGRGRREEGPQACRAGPPPAQPAHGRVGVRGALQRRPRPHSAAALGPPHGPPARRSPQPPRHQAPPPPPPSPSAARTETPAGATPPGPALRVSPFPQAAVRSWQNSGLPPGVKGALNPHHGHRLRRTRQVRSADLLLAQIKQPAPQMPPNAPQFREKGADEDT